MLPPLYLSFSPSFGGGGGVGTVFLGFFWRDSPPIHWMKPCWWKDTSLFLQEEYTGKVITNLPCIGRMTEYEFWSSTFSQVSMISKDVDSKLNKRSLFSTTTPFSSEVSESTANVFMLDVFCLTSNGSFKLSTSLVSPSPMSWSLRQARVFECAVMQAHDTSFPGHIAGASHIIDVLSSKSEENSMHDYKLLSATVL